MSRDPVPPAVRSCYGVFYLMYMGRFRAAIGELDLALSDDPLSVEQRYLLGVALLQAGRTDEGIARLHGALELDDAFMPPYVVLAFMATREARFADALAHAERAYALGSFDPVVVGVLAAALVNTGDDARAQHILAPLGDGSGPGTSLGLGIFHLLRDDVERAADCMTRAIEERYPGILFFLNSQTGAALRASARWPKLRQMLNLPRRRDDGSLVAAAIPRPVPGQLPHPVHASWRASAGSAARSSSSRSSPTSCCWPASSACRSAAWRRRTGANLIETVVPTLLVGMALALARPLRVHQVQRRHDRRRRAGVAAADLLRHRVPRARSRRGSSCRSRRSPARSSS